MTQSKMNNDEYVITLDSGEKIDLNGIIDTTGDITIDLNDYNMGTTTTYWAGDSVTDITLDTGAASGTLTIDSTVYTGSTDVNLDWIYDGMNININKVENMCKEYPALEKVWRNFKSVYDMCKQDYEGKKKAGELDDDIPF